MSVHRTFHKRRKTAGRALLMAMLLAAAPTVGLAQETGIGEGFLPHAVGGDRGREAGAYASPSGIPDAAPGDIGVNLPQPMRKLEPIALPRPPGEDGRGDLSLPALPAYAPATPLGLPALDLKPKAKLLHLDAKLVENGPKVPSGLVWRLFSPKPGPDGKLPLVASIEGGGADFDVAPGAYLLHVGFGRAGVTRRIDVGSSPMREEVVLGAGGLKLDATVAGNAKIASDKLSFSIYSDEDDERDRRLITDDVDADAVVPLNAGSYRVISKYGDDNAEVGAEVKVEAGKVTDVTLQHRAAELTMKLVRETGGEAIADTAWQVTDASGTLIRQSVGAFPSMVLSEGEYLVVAKNRDKTYQRDFEVQAGVNADVELKTTDVLPRQDSTEGSGD